MGQPHTRLHYKEGSQHIEGSYCSPLLDTARQELAYDSQFGGPSITGETDTLMGDRA